MILLGEIQTGLLRNSAALSAGSAAAVLGVRAGETARYGERPVRFAISPDVLTGVDCTLASPSTKPRGIGTARSRATIIGGQMLLSSSYVAVVPASGTKRLPWSHYLAKPGTLEVIGKWTAPALCDGFLEATVPPPTLDLGAMNARLVRQVQSHGLLDARAPFRAQATRFRWAAAMALEGHGCLFHVQHNGMRTINLQATWDDPRHLAEICEDIALHDWLLITIGKLLDQSMIGQAARKEVVSRLQPALDFMMHLWLPGLRPGTRAQPIWDGLENHLGFSRQWQASVDRIRDQLSLAAVTRLLSSRSFDHS